MKSDASKKTFTVISFNAFGAPFEAQRVLKTLFTTHVYKRFAYLADQLNKSDADIIALQEVNTYPQYFYLKMLLKKFPYAYYRPYIQGPKGGVVMFTKMKFESVKYVTFEKRGTIFNKSFIASILRRGLLIGKVAGMPLVVINTHLTQNLARDWSKKGSIRSIHDAQLAQIIECLHEDELHDKNILIAGDFNIPKSSDLFTTFLKRSNLTDVFREYTRATYHEEYQKLGRIDHVFLLENSGSVDILKREHLFEEKVTLKNGKQYYLSDHIGLYVKLRMEV